MTIGALILQLSLWFHGSRTLSVIDFTPAFLITGALAVLSSLIYFRLEPHAGEVISGRREIVVRSSSAEPAAAAD